MYVTVHQPTTVSRLDGTRTAYTPTGGTAKTATKPAWQQAGFTTEADYLAEVARKRAAGIPLTNPELAAGYDKPAAPPYPAAASGLALPAYTPGQFKPSVMSAMSYDEALGRAQSRLAPSFSQTRTSLGATAQQQQELLRQRLAAKGQLRGGGAERGSEEISAGLLASLASLDSNQLSQVASLAQELYDADQARAAQERNQEFQEYQAGESANLAAANMGASNYWNTVGQGNTERAFNAEQENLDRNFQYQVNRDNVLDERWMQQFTYQQKLDMINQALQNRQISASEANAAASRALQREQFEYGKEQDAAAQTRADQASDAELRGMALQLAKSALGDYADATELRELAQQYYQYLKGGAMPAAVESGLGNDADQWLKPGT
jgi:hypothetical protein